MSDNDRVAEGQRGPHRRLAPTTPMRPGVARRRAARRLAPAPTEGPAAHGRRATAPGAAARVAGRRWDSARSCGWPKSAVTPTQDTAAHSPSRSGPTASTGRTSASAWNDVQINQYFAQHGAHRARRRGCVQVLVATTAGYALSVLRPQVRARWSRALVLATLFIPSIVLLVPLYLTIRATAAARAQSLLNTFWAVWLPAGANAFNVLLVKRFFDSPAARGLRGGAHGRRRALPRCSGRWCFRCRSRSSGSCSVFAVITAWKDFLWPMLSPSRTRRCSPLSVRLPAAQAQTRAGCLPRGARDLDRSSRSLLFLLFQPRVPPSGRPRRAVKG